MQHLKIGHYTHEEHGTGVTVFLFDHSARGAYTLCGSAPATHELETLELDSIVPEVNGLLFSGGSAFGLSAVEGVMRWQKEQNQGFNTPSGVVPIVPAVGLYDLSIKQAFAPTAVMAYEACQNAVENNLMEGSVGAGTGASVGKLVLSAQCMSGGLGRAEIKLSNGVSVVAYAVVNSAGDVLNETGEIIAGACLKDGRFADCTKYLLSGQNDWTGFECNTTLVAVFTNAFFSKAELKRISKMAVAGMARAISPIFTRYDGDIIFCFSLGEHKTSESVIGTMAAHAVRQAIVNAVKHSVPL
jgi:L-aminopeptidase/D-esterase-like protein